MIFKWYFKICWLLHYRHFCLILFFLEDHTYFELSLTYTNHEKLLLAEEWILILKIWIMTTDQLKVSLLFTSEKDRHTTDACCCIKIYNATLLISIKDTAYIVNAFQNLSILGKMTSIQLPRMIEKSFILAWNTVAHIY